MQNKIKKMTFETAFIALSETLETLEKGDLSLAEAIDLYEYGSNLAKHCSTHLDTAELRVKKLSASGNLEAFNEGE